MFTRESFGMMIGMLAIGVSSVLAGQTEVGPAGGTFGHNYKGWGNPQGFSLRELYMVSNMVEGTSDDGPSLTVAQGTTSSTPGYAIYKYVTPAGATITQIQLTLRTYLEGGWSTNNAKVYYTTGDFGGEPDFSTWTDLGYTWTQYNSERTLNFSPNSHVVYVAYVAWNNGGPSWGVQMLRDKLDIVVGNPPTAQIDVGPAGGTFGHNYIGEGSPQGFIATDTFMTRNIGFSTQGYFAPDTAESAPGYVIYKYVAAAGTKISDIRLTLKTYLDSGVSGINNVQVFYTTGDFTGLPIFSTWTNLNYTWSRYDSESTLTFNPNSTVLYIAYVGWTTGTQGWEAQLMKDQLEITTRSTRNQINIAEEGGDYGHNYTADGDPRGFTDEDTYMSGRVSFSTTASIAQNTTTGNPGYLIFKYVVPAGKLITEVQLTLNTYLNGGWPTNGMSVYYTTTDISDTPDFTTWNNLSYAWTQYGSQGKFTLNPNSQVVYIAYVGWNNGEPSWGVQINKDYLKISTDILKKDLTRGHYILLQKGLQIQAMCFPLLEDDYSTVTGFDLNRFAQSNFTGADLVWNFWSLSYLGAAPGIPWSVWGNFHLPEADIPYLPSMVRFQYGDEVDITDPGTVQAMKTWFAYNRNNYPEVISHDDQSGGVYSLEANKAYVVEARPDMVMFNFYTFDGDLTGGSPTTLYEYFQKYRMVGLAGLDGDGTRPIPYAFYLQTYVRNNHTPSESELYLNQFAGWAFGYKLACAFIYNEPFSYHRYDSILFNGMSDSSPTAQFYQMAEINRQSRNLGPALVRLLSTDVRFIPGQHAVKVLGIIIRTDDNAVPAGITGGIGGADPYITGISASNPGGKNDNKRGDVIVGFFKPLHPSFEGTQYPDEKYFMITNGLSDGGGSAADTRQNIHITFNLPSNITSLQRLSRTTGQVEVVSLVNDGSGNYHLDLTLDGGAGDLFKYNTGAPFVGITPPVAPVFSVAPDSQSVSAPAGSTTFNVANAGTGTMSWSAQVIGGGDWLQITGTSGTNTGTITANYQANTGSQRTGTIRIDAGFVGTRDVTVIQAAGQVQQPTVHGTVTYADVAGYPLNTVTVEIRNGTTIVETHSGLALTGSTGSKAYTFVTGLTGGPYTLAIVKNAQTGWKESVQSGVTLAADTTVNFTVTHAIAGDASMDGKVDVSDLGILAANYGGTGKTWSLGDFNGDGKVDVSDLGILAANYGQGSGGATQAGDFPQDMKALGLSLDSSAGEPAETQTIETEENPEAKSLGGCGNAGLPLIVGIFLAAMGLGVSKIE